MHEGRYAKLKIVHPSGPVAQVVEHLPFKQRVAGSSPARLTKTHEIKSSCSRLQGAFARRVLHDCHREVSVASNQHTIKGQLAALGAIQRYWSEKPAFGLEMQEGLWQSTD